MKLEYNFTFEDLYKEDKLKTLHEIFLQFFKDNDQELFFKYQTLPDKNDIENSNILIATAKILEEFITKFFNLYDQISKLRQKHLFLNLIPHIKKYFIQKRAIRKFKIEDLERISHEEILAEIENILQCKFSELILAKKIQEWLDDNDEIKLSSAAKYCAWASLTKEGKKKHKNSVLFNFPEKLDIINLVDIAHDNYDILTNKNYRHREGFALTDKLKNLDYTIDQTNYCLICHNREKDSCSKGLKNDDQFKISDLNVPLTGCPLEEKISEMNQLKKEGFAIGSLAMICVDNPMVAATGHRICNDCMKACIFQKQTPVDIPHIETKILNDVLNLTYGFEIYSLLTRWNPLNYEHPYPKANSNYKILVAGLGPSGFTLAHHLLNCGHNIYAIDGLKIEPLPKDIINFPIKDVNQLYENLDERIVGGFGGVTEYGITVRWNKNYLKLIRLLLERRKNYHYYSGIRFGGTITTNQAFKLGFDHIALCLGAGKPNIPDITNILAKGARTASDFLMALQLTKASSYSSLANLQIRLPVIVIGGGLTAIDTATEALAYYPIQVEKFLQKVEKIGLENLDLSPEETIIAEEFITHAKLLREEKEKANPQITKLLFKLGGVRIIYRKNLIDSPSYRLNHEEVDKALEEGIRFVENMMPKSIEVDKFDSVKALICTNINNDSQDISFNAKTILIATGTSPNTILAKEEAGIYKVHNKYFKLIDENENIIEPAMIAKPSQIHALTSITAEGKAISFFGDLHPSFHGNVVKAMASAKKGYKVIDNILYKTPPSKIDHFNEKIDDLFTAKIHAINRLTPNIIELVLYAPLAATNFQPGQFYRLQNFETNAKIINNIKLVTEGLAMTGAWVDKEKNLISTIILEMGGSSSLVKYFDIGQEIILMGPTGTPTEIKPNEKVILIGGGLGNAVLFSIGKAFKELNSEVIYFAGYKKAQDRYKIEEIQAAADQIIWCCDEKKLSITRANDISLHMNIVDAIENYAQDNDLKQINRIITIGSDNMMNAVNIALSTTLKNYFKDNIIKIASINSPMQCMMKEICAQCLQKHIDPITKKISYVYSCFNQDQAMTHVDFSFLNQRLKQNSLQEKVLSKYLKLNAIT